MKSLLTSTAAMVAAAFARVTPSAQAYAPAPRVGPKPVGGDGVKRAAARLKEHKAQWDHLPDGSVMTRQRSRRAELLLQKKKRSAAKAHAQSHKVMGGAASIL